MKIYISGKITGLEIGHAFQIFEDAEITLKEKGHEVLNPMKLVPFNPDLTWVDYMKADIAAILDCDAIYMLENWKESKGARLERHIAEHLELVILEQIVNNS